MTGTLIFLLLCLFGLCCAACPESLSKACVCEDEANGFNVICQNVGTDLNTLLSAFGKVRIDRLTVVQSTWPIVKRVLPASIRSLRLIGCSIREVEDGAFTPLSGTLEELVLANNSITKFPALGTLPKLQSLSFNHNKLTSIPENALNGTNQLRHLRLEGNQISELSRNALSTVKYLLELLDMSGNSFIQVPAEALSSFGNLMYLDLSENKIGALANNDFKTLPKLKELRLNDNAITSIGSMAFQNVQGLQYLYLQKNLLNNLASLHFREKFPMLETLDLSHNSLTKVPSLTNHQTLRQLKLDDNRLSVIGSRAFSSIPKLELLSVQNNEIVSVAESSFSGLGQLTILLLENNFIRRLDKNMLKGMGRLQQLNLRNNSLNELGNDTFRMVSGLKMLDLAYNGLHRIPRTLFLPLKSIVWLDLSHNLLSFFEEGTFVDKIPHIILVGNPWHCDEKLNWFVGYLLRYHVRIHLPLHREVTCASPEKFIGVRLQDLIAKKTEDTLITIGKPMNPPSMGNRQDMFNGLLPPGLSRLIPGITPAPPPNPVADVPVIGALAEAVPSFRNIPGLSFIPKVQGARTQEVRKLNSAIEQFSTPLLRIASGDSLMLAEDVDQMLQAVPKFAIKSNVDLSELPPKMMVRVFRGEGVPGLPKEAVEDGLKKYTFKIYKAALAISNGNSLLDQPDHLLVLNGVPQEIVADIVRGAQLPYLTDEQMDVVKEYFGVKVKPPKNDTPKEPLSLSNIELSPELFRMMKLLPQGYDIKKIPREVIESVSRGELPDLTLLPVELQRYFVDNFQRLFVGFAKEGAEFEDVIKKLPMFERTEVTTFSPYAAETGGIRGEKESKLQNSFLHFAAVVVAVVGFVSAIVLGSFCIYRKRQKVHAETDKNSIERVEDSFAISTPQKDECRTSAIQIPFRPPFGNSSRCPSPGCPPQTQLES